MKRPCDETTGNPLVLDIYLSYRSDEGLFMAKRNPYKLYSPKWLSILSVYGLAIGQIKGRSWPYDTCSWLISYNEVCKLWRFGTLGRSSTTHIMHMKQGTLFKTHEHVKIDEKFRNNNFCKSKVMVFFPCHKLEKSSEHVLVSGQDK